MKMFKVLLGVVISMNAFAETYELKSMAPGLLPPEQPYISINPGYISFPNTEINSESSVTATITNSSSVNPLTGLRVVVDASVFSLENNNCGTSAAPLAQLGPLESCSTLIKFKPVVPGSYTGTFGASANNAVNGVQSILMSGYGQGYESFVDMTTDSLSFSILQGDSALKTLNFVNNGTYQSTNTRVELTGSPILTLTNANTCGTVADPVSVGVNQSCSAPITVSSLSAGSFSSYATLKTANGTPVIKAFNVTVNPAISNAIVASGSLNFGVITPSTPKSTSVVVRNSGYVPATAAFVEVPSVDGLSIQTNTCGTQASPVNIPVNGTCSLFLSYTSDRAFTFSNTAVAVQGFDNALSIPVQGQVSGNEAFAEISSNRTAFSAIVPNADSVTYTFKNTGNIYSQNTYASISGATFSMTSNTCGTQGSPIELAPNGTCSVTVQATSETAGNFSGLVAINSNNVTNVASKALTFDAIGATAYAATSNGAVDFGSIVYDASNSTYVDRTVNVTNTGNSALTVNTVSGLPAGTAFQSSTCSNIAVNGTCALVFRLKSDGTTSFTNAPITLNGPTGQDSITLTGSVVAQTRIASVTAGSPITFTTVSKGGTSPTASVTIRNTGNSPMTLTGATNLPSSVSVTANTCSNIAVNNTCSMTFTMSSANVTSFSNTVVTTVGATTNANITMSGTVSGSVVSITSGSSVDFGAVDYGSTATKVVSITNSGNTPLTISSLSGLPMGYMSLTGNTCSNIAAGGSCQLTITLNTTSVATISNISVTTIGATTNATFTVSSSINASVASVTSGSPINFGAVFVGDAAPSAVVSIKNIGQRPLTISGISGAPTSVSVTANTCSNISANGTCSITLTMSTAAVASFSNTTILTTGADSNAGILVSGSVTAKTAIASVSSSVAFGSVQVGSSSVIRAVTVTNTGNSPLTLTGVSGLPSAVSLTANTCSSVAVNGTCSLTFTMATTIATSFSTSVSTIGGTTNATFSMSGSVTSPNFAYNATISTSVNNFNLRTQAIAAGWDGVSALNATVTINSAVVVGSASTASPSFDATGSFPAGSSLTLTNNGSIIGKGGAGGAGSSLGGAATAGSAGGPAISVALSTSISNNGTIAGGGGGGGGGGGQTGYVGGTQFKAGGGGGGAGQGNTASAGGVGGSSDRGSCTVSGCPITIAAAGGASSATGSGAGGAAGQVRWATTSYYVQGGGGGQGGSIGSVGSSGTSGTFSLTTSNVSISGAAGGAPGPYAVGNSLITWTVIGTRLGSVVN